MSEFLCLFPPVEFGYKDIFLALDVLANCFCVYSPPKIFFPLGLPFKIDWTFNHKAIMIEIDICNI